MKAREHKEIGDVATGGALVDLVDVSAGEPFRLRFGDVVALSGDYFTADELSALAAAPGDHGQRLGTRDEIVCALKVMALDDQVVDPRFEPGGEFAGYRFSPSVADMPVERSVRDRFLALGATNTDHFVTPWAGEPADPGRHAGRYGSAPLAYRHLHHVALDTAARLGRQGGDLGLAMAREAAAQHFLTDAFAAGHLRTPVAAMRRFWAARYPWFWEFLQRKVAADTAAALRELAWPLRLVPADVINGQALAAVRARTAHYPPISLGDLLAKVFHDWDNTHGLRLDDGSVVFGDGCLDQGVTRERVLKAARSGIDDVVAAYGLGAQGTDVAAGALFAAVREVTGAPGDRFVAETLLPRPALDGPVQNWRAGDFEVLWDEPIVGSSGATVGHAVAEMLEEGQELPRRLACLGHGVGDVIDLPVPPMLRRRLEGWICEAYHRGFIEGLCRNPKRALLDVLARTAGGLGDTSDAPAPSSHTAARAQNWRQ